MTSGMRSNRKRGQRYEHRFNEWTCAKKMMLFSLPLIAGNLLQQTYNIADTVIVGRFLGADALAAVGSSYTLMTFFDFDSAGAVHGKRCIIFHPVWRKE